MPDSSTSVTLGQSSGVTADGTTIANTGGTISVKDPLVPTDGTQNITGALSVSSNINNGGAITGPLGIGKSATQRTTFDFNVAGDTMVQGGGIADSGTNAAVVLYGSAPSNTVLASASVRLVSVSNAGTEKLAIGIAGQVTPGVGISGASAITWVGRGTYVIDFGAFTAGIDQTSAQVLTGVAFGDCLSIGCSADQSATIGQMTAMVSSAGNVVITVSPVSTTSTANPASATYTVTAIRTA